MCRPKKKLITNEWIPLEFPAYIFKGDNTLQCGETYIEKYIYREKGPGYILKGSKFLELVNLGNLTPMSIGGKSENLHACLRLAYGVILNQIPVSPSAFKTSPFPM